MRSPVAGGIAAAAIILAAALTGSPAATATHRAEDVEPALLRSADLPPGSGLLTQRPSTIDLADHSQSNLGSAQMLRGVVIEPAACGSWLTSGFAAPERLRGMSRVFPRSTAPGSAVPFRQGLVASTVVTSPADLGQVRRRLAGCAVGTVTMTDFGVTGKLTTREVAAGRDRLVVRQSAVWPRGMSKEARAFARLFESTSVVAVRGGWTLIVVSAGDVGLTPDVLIGRAVSRADRARHG